MSITNLKFPLALERCIAALADGSGQSAHAFGSHCKGGAEFIAKRDPVLAAITNVREAVQILALDSLIDRLVDPRRRELIISKGRTRYVVWYRWFEALRRHWCSGPVSRVSGSLDRAPEIDAP